MAGTARLELQGLTDAVRRMMAQAEVESERLPRTRGDRPYSSGLRLQWHDSYCAT